MDIQQIIEKIKFELKEIELQEQLQRAKIQNEILKREIEIENERSNNEQNNILIQTEYNIPIECYIDYNVFLKYFAPRCGNCGKILTEKYKICPKCGCGIDWCKNE